MKLLHNIGYTPNNSNYNTPEQVKACKQQLSFDGVYMNVWTHRHLLLSRNQKTILFVMGNTIGGDNAFDAPMPRELYCDWSKLMDLVVNFNCELGWHSWSHRDLTTLSDTELMVEVSPPFRMRYFAYPYGRLDERVEAYVRAAGYEDAYSVHQGNEGPFQRNREYLK